MRTSRARLGPAIAAAAASAAPIVAPFVPASVAARRAAALLSGAISLHPFRPMRAALILTRTEGMKPSLIDKGAAAILARLARDAQEQLLAYLTGSNAPDLPECATRSRSKYSYTTPYEQTGQVVRDAITYCTTSSFLY